MWNVSDEQITLAFYRKKIVSECFKIKSFQERITAMIMTSNYESQEFLSKEIFEHNHKRTIYIKDDDEQY